ncbi:hypothetical protein [Rhodoligotrophos defluvii]|uniref:hypothetical protein n=1 Tax=Rhodoligotrophos defluvii TaxID=2561934 RepID=UPI0010C9E892|nr:hypothetical protein [Rhodoligotrophos defluvii]
MRTDAKVLNHDRRVLMLLIAALCLINMGLAVVAFSGPFGATRPVDGYGVRVSDTVLTWAQEPGSHRVN